MNQSFQLFREIKAAYDLHGQSLRHLGFWAIATYLVGRRALDSKSPILRPILNAFYVVMEFLVDINSGVQLHREVTVGMGLHLIHGWNIKIHPSVVLGDRVGIMHDVTLGSNPDRQGAPTVGNDVFIGAGAKVLGPVHIGDGAWIAANSLVISDVPAGATAIGVPARVMRYTGDTEHVGRAVVPKAVTSKPAE